VISSRQDRTLAFTDRWLSALKPAAAGSLEYFDSDKGAPPGFGVRVFESGVKSFFLVYRRAGRKRRYTVGRFPILKLSEARSKAKGIYNSGGDPLGDRERALEAGSFAAVATAWAEKATKRQHEPLSETTLKEYRRIVAVLAKHRAFEVLFPEVTRNDVERFLAELAETSPDTANKAYVVLRNVYRYAVKRKLIERSADFMATMERPARKSLQRDRVLSRDELRAIWLALDDDTEALVLRAYFRTLFYCGTRKTETLTARWKDINPDAKVWSIPGSDTKSGKPHEVPLSEPAWKVLEALGTLCGRNGYVFPGAKRGQHLVNPQDTKNRVEKKTGLSFRLHDIRRTVATGLAELGIRPDVVSAILGHTIGGNTETRIYERWHRLPEKRDALERWGRHLESIVTDAQGDVVEFRR
jgi:integrase